jgi:ABC-type transporter Mla MlaB component
MAAVPERRICLALGTRVERDEIPGLCGMLYRVRCEDETVELAVCDVGALRRADVVVIEALARLALTAQRLGFRFEVHNASPLLRGLVELTGLDGVLCLEPLGEPEQREQHGGVEEVHDRRDLAF